MFLRFTVGLLLAGASLATPALLHAQQAPATKTFKLLRAEDFPLVGLVPPPPPRGSDLEKLELAYLHALIAGTTPERMEQARWDDAHEDPSIFNKVMGVDLKTLPATWELLNLVFNDGNVGSMGIKEHFGRIRPWGVDPTMPNCDAGKGKSPGRSYPSGHSTLGYSVGLTLATLVPNKAQAILERARDYALSREICGVHYPSDTEASHVIGSIAAQRILAHPAMADRIAAARAELAGVAP